MNEMRRLINLVESIENDPELLEEGLRDKILGAVAAAGIALGGQAAAETVFVYQDGDSLQTVESYMDIPDDAPMAYAIDTETQKIKMIKGDSPMVQKADVPSREPVSIPTADELKNDKHFLYRKNPEKWGWAETIVDMPFDEAYDAALGYAQRHWQGGGAQMVGEPYVNKEKGEAAIPKIIHYIIPRKGIWEVMRLYRLDANRTQIQMGSIVGGVTKKGNENRAQEFIDTIKDELQ